jgi:hypothetical protein
MSPADMFDPNFMPILQSMTQALIEYTPEGFITSRCIIAQASGHERGRLQYEIHFSGRSDQDTTAPSSNLHDAAFKLFRHWTKEGNAFPRTEVSVSKQPDGRWKSNVQRLDDGQEDNVLSDDEREKRWQEVYGAREDFFTSRFGTLPGDIQKLMNLMSIWPGGGIFPIEATKMRGMGVCISCGLSNYDMPTPVRLAKYERSDNGGSPSFKSQLEPRTPRWVPTDLAGYGYEVMIVTPKPERWPLLPLSWLIQMEILNDVGLLGRVREHEGLTVESVKIGDGTQTADFLINPAVDPLPSSLRFPNGTMHLLVATRITREEMKFSLQNVRPALAERLRQAGVGQTSNLERRSVA